MDSPDNITVTPRGGLITCEDDASSEYVDTHPLAPGIEHVNRLIGLTQGGEAFELAVNVLNGSEMAGACFSPSGRTLFFNLFGRARFTEDPVEGMTCAVTGPWRRGPLFRRSPSGRAFRQTALPHMGWLGYTLITVAC